MYHWSGLANSRPDLNNHWASSLACRQAAYWMRLSTGLRNSRLSHNKLIFLVVTKCTAEFLKTSGKQGRTWLCTSSLTWVKRWDWNLVVFTNSHSIFWKHRIYFHLKTQILDHKNTQCVKLVFNSCWMLSKNTHIRNNLPNIHVLFDSSFSAS